MANLLFLNYEYPPLGGGAGECTQRQAAGLALKGHEIVVITAGYAGLPEREQQAPGLKLIRVKSRRNSVFNSNPLEMFDWMMKARAFILDNFQGGDFDLCFANFSIPGGLLALHIKKSLQLNFVLISHGQDLPWFYPSGLFFLHLLTYPLNRYIWLRSGLNITLSKEMKKMADRFCGKANAKKNLIIANGFLRPEIAVEKEYNACIRILYAARLVKQKDPLCLIKAAVILKRQNIPFYMDVFGDGHYYKHLEKIIKKESLKDSVCLHSWRNRAEVREYMSRSHIYVCTSRAEAMSLSMIDALAYGNYLITTPVSGTSAMLDVGLNVVFFRKGRANELACKIKQYYYSSFLNKIQMPQSELIDKLGDYEWETIVGKYDACIKKLLK